MAFALKHYNIGKIEDLSDYNFIAFQNACKYLGETFEKVTIKADKKYSEVADQKQQVYMLLKDRIDIIVMDRHIFQFYKNELISEGKIEKIFKQRYMNFLNQHNIVLLLKMKTKR